jgi:hypothetical protein
MPKFASPEPITITLSTYGAQVRVTASERSDTVVLVEPINGASTLDVTVAEDTKVRFSARKLSIKTTTPGHKSGSIAVTIEAPTRSGLVLNSAWTDVQADGLFGDCRLDIASGKVQLDRIASLRGNLAAGDVAIGHVAETVDIENSTAGLRIDEVAGTVKYQGAVGRIWIGHAVSNIELNTATGSFDIDRADGSVTATAHTCPIRIGRMTRGRAELANNSGGIEIGISEGTAAVVDAESKKGAVRNYLPAQDGLDEVDDQVRIHARARRDDIVVRRAAD